jgi:hypothetical protein
MTKRPSTDLAVTPDEIQRMVHVVRGQRVMLDFDLARLYGVTTRRLNEQVARNRERFPADFAHQLTRQEVAALMSQNAISKGGRGRRRAPGDCSPQAGLPATMAAGQGQEYFGTTPAASMAGEGTKQ